MKTTTFRIISVIFFLSLSFFSVYSTEYPLNQQSGTINLTTGGESPSYRSDLYNVWNINTGVFKPVKFSCHYNLYGSDSIIIYSVSETNTAIRLTRLTGIFLPSSSGVFNISTIIPSGKARVVLVSRQSAPTSSNYASISFSVENNSSVSGNLSVAGSGTFTGGIISSGTSYFYQPTYFNNTTQILKASVGSLSGSTTQALNVKGVASITTDGATPDEGYKGSLMITRPAASGQYINLVRQGQYPWSIGMVYNTNNFAIGQGNATDASFTNPFFTIKGDNGNVGIGTTTPPSTLSVAGSISKLTLIGIDNTFDNLIKFGYKGDLESGTSNANRWHGIDATITAGDASQNKMKFRLFGGGTTNTAPIDVMTLQGNGNVGIGTTNPQAPLQIGNSISDIGTPKFRIVAPVLGGAGTVTDALHIDTNDGGNFDKGVAISIGAMYSVYGEYTSRIIHYGSIANTRASRLQLQTHSANQGVWNTGILIDQKGKVGIGTTNPDSLLTVNGSIHAKAVVVDLAVPADYVFKPNYKLMPLHQVEQFVKTNSHLPEIPSADEIVKNGMNMGEMQNKLLQKVEELTLYVIEQQKQINSQTQKIKELERRIEK